jgi:dipeptidyl aminopeptidase/acylaminoacyl peptidase
MRNELERVDIPGEVEAYGRTWATLESAFAERTPAPRRSQWPRAAAIAVALAALLAAALSPPGQAVIDEIREVVGVERAERALFSLPSSGKLLVASDAGIWVVQPDGSKRLLGDYREASWSPFGRFVVAARADELAALETDGTLRWSLPRAGIRTPRWAGSVVDTRIAYVDRSGLRVVAGDGTGDRLLVPGFAGTIAWRPGERFVLAYATASRIVVVDAETGRRLWRRARAGGQAPSLSWSSDGRRLIAAAPGSLVVYAGRSGIPYELGPGAAPVTAAALAPSGRSLVFAQQAGRRGQVWVLPRIRPDASAARRLFSGSATFDQVAWSPDGRWVVVAWPAADQWVFLRANGAGIRAVANVSEQFRSRSFPRIEGWCCAR